MIMVIIIKMIMKIIINDNNDNDHNGKKKIITNIKQSKKPLFLYNNVKLNVHENCCIVKKNWEKKKISTL